MIAEGLQPVIVCAAFWLAILLHQRRDPARTGRFAIGLVAGAVASRLGWALGFSGEPFARALDTPGASVLFLPLGPLLLARHGASFTCLPLPIALSRLGCVAAGCCRGEAGAMLPLLDAGAFVLLHAVCRSRTAAAVERTFLFGFGAIRWAESPWRETGPGGLVPPSLIALGWLVLGLVLEARSARSGDEPAKSTSRSDDAGRVACRDGHGVVHSPRHARTHPRRR